MSAHGPPEVEAAPPASALGRFANSMEAVLRPFYTWLCYVAAAVLGLLILTILYSIIGRRFGAALPGSQEIIEQSLVIIVFGAMGLEHMGHEKMSVDVIARHLPKGVQMVIAPIIYIIAVAIIVIAVWQLVVWGIDMQDRGRTTMGVLGLPWHPFIYVAAFGMATLIPIWVARFLRSIDKAVKR
jgi:TRAP-type C4-dicarboxylate transport system permease small subunit